MCQRLCRRHTARINIGDSQELNIMSHFQKSAFGLCKINLESSLKDVSKRNQSLLGVEVCPAWVSSNELQVYRSERCKPDLTLWLLEAIVCEVSLFCLFTELICQLNDLNCRVHFIFKINCKLGKVHNYIRNVFTG